MRILKKGKLIAIEFREVNLYMLEFPHTKLLIV